MVRQSRLPRMVRARSEGLRVRLVKGVGVRVRVRGEGGGVSLEAK